MRFNIRHFPRVSHGSGISPASAGCIDPSLGEQITAYCFGDLPESDRQAVEAHFLDCNSCWKTVKRLAPAVETLHTDRSLMLNIKPADVCSVLGISARLDSWLGGHGSYAVLVAALYGCIYALCLMAEISYAFDRLGQTAVWVASATFAWVVITTIGALTVDWKLTRRGNHSGLGAAIGVLVGATVLMFTGLSVFLPNSPVTEMDIPAQTARGAYLKDIVYTVPVVLIVLAVPFHFVLALQKEFQEGRYRPSLALLSGDRKAVTPEGAIHIRPAALSVMLLVAFLISIPLTMGLFSHLKTGPYQGLFTIWIYLRWIAYFGLGLTCVLWYSHVLNRLKRECLTAEEVQF